MTVSESPKILSKYHKRFFPLFTQRSLNNVKFKSDRLFFFIPSPSKEVEFEQINILIGSSGTTNILPFWGFHKSCAAFKVLRKLKKKELSLTLTDLVHSFKYAPPWRGAPTVIHIIKKEPTEEPTAGKVQNKDAVPIGLSRARCDTNTDLLQVFFGLRWPQLFPASLKGEGWKSVVC